MPLPLLAGMLLVRQSDAFGASAEHRWAFDAIALAMRERDLVAYPDDSDMGRGRPPSRYEIVVDLHVSATDQLRRAEAFLKKPFDDVERASLLRSAALLPVYKRAEREFKKEFLSLGIQGDFGQSRLAAVTRQIEATAPVRSRLFRDVPAHHWAAKTVGDLRALGLLDGYPDGTYKGSR